MKDLALDPQTWDIEKAGKDQRICSGIEALQQRLRIKLSHITGEWYLNEDAGVLAFDLFKQKNPQIPVVSGIVRGTIQRDPDIRTIDFLKVDFDASKRVFSVSFTAGSIYGPVSLEGVVL